MIRFEVRWKNFRGFEDTRWLRIRPITVLIGSNSSGKSSLIAPLLLLKQTLRSMNPEIALVTRGELANVGSFRDMVTGHDSEKAVEFGVRWHSHPPDGDEEPVGNYPPGEMRLTFGEQEPGEIALTRYQVFDVHQRKYLERRKRNAGYTLEGLPEKRRRESNRLVRIGDEAALHEQPRHFLFDGRSVVQAQVRWAAEVEPEHRDESWSPEFRFSPFALEYINVVNAAAGPMTVLLRETSYLGPLREPLSRVYELSGDPPRDVGTRGEYAPEVLYRNPDLLAATQDWLKHFGLGRASMRRSTREDAFSLVLPAGGGRPSVNFADAGFGASQLLPLVVQGLFGEPDSLLVAEQPEIHLNPRLQSGIADFFCYLAEHDKGVLAETHSEHLLLRLRTLMARGEVKEDDVALYFVHQEGRESFVRPIPVNGEGRIRPKDWPEGFFQDSVREALTLATEQARRPKSAG